MRNWIVRNMPLLMAVLVFIALYQFVEKHWPGAAGIDRAAKMTAAFLRDHIAFVAAAALLGWMLIVLGWMHERGTLPRFLSARWIVDILNRLTNKQAIEDGLGKVEEAVFIDAASLARTLKEKVIGQDAVCDDVAMQIRRRMALAQRGKPVGIFLFAGPPGTGKTYLAKVLARELTRPLVHLDMTQFSAGTHSLSELFGMSKGYVGSDSYGKLTATLRDTPNALVLLDEIEKAHPDVVKAFLTAWNDGFITERSDGTLISTTGAIFVLTTNAATDTLTRADAEVGNDPDALRVRAIGALRDAQFAPEVLNRLDRIFVFRQLKGLDIARVTALEIEAMIKGYGLDVADQGIDAQIILALMERQQKMGKSGSSRDIVRAIEEQLADSLIEAKRRGFTQVELRNEGGRVTARATRKPGAP